MSDCLVVLSGGQDSTTCLYWAMEHYDEVHAITFGYGQRHNIEMQAAKVVGVLAGVASHEFVNLGHDTLKGASPLVSDNELEQYESHDVLPGGLEKTFVPMRNQLFLTVAANRAYNLGIRHIVTGVSGEDYGGYPDCRQEFIDAFAKASSLGTFTGEEGAPGPLQIHTPLMNLTKKQTVELSLDLGVCYEALAYTHTAYDGKFPPTGNDHATLLREKGFEEAGYPDPLWLRAHLQGYTLPYHPIYDRNNPVVQEAIQRVAWSLEVVALARRNGDI